MSLPLKQPSMAEGELEECEDLEEAGRAARLAMRLAAAAQWVPGPREPLTGDEWKAYAIRVHFIDPFGSAYPWWRLVQPGPWTWGDLKQWLRRWVAAVEAVHKARTNGGLDKVVGTTATEFAFIGDPLRRAVRDAAEDAKAAARAKETLAFFLRFVWTLLADLAWIRTHAVHGDTLADALHPLDFRPLAVVYPPHPSAWLIQPPFPTPLKPDRRDAEPRREPLDDA